MSKKNGNKPYSVKKTFDVEYLTDFLIGEVEEGNLSWKEAIRDAALTSRAEEYFETRFDTKDLMGTEYDTETGEVIWELMEDYQLNF